VTAAQGLLPPGCGLDISAQLSVAMVGVSIIKDIPAPLQSMPVDFQSAIDESQNSRLNQFD
jgi:hypothetical protein